MMSLLALATLALQAQAIGFWTPNYHLDKSGVKEYAKSVGSFFPRPEVKTDKKKTTAVWHGTNMDWVKDY